MKTDNHLAAKGGEVKETRAEKAIRLLTTTAANPFHQKLDEFKTFYPAIATAKRNGLKHKQIIRILAEGGLKLYPSLFEKLMAAMKAEESHRTCPHCGQTMRDLGSASDDIGIEVSSDDVANFGRFDRPVHS
ncbi:hypothetical protein [Dyella japonica]|uniref:Transposase n=1 Tax=Dyella japonica TaxID=231455 RepID=A0ABV2JWB5_9GAMM